MWDREIVIDALNRCTLQGRHSGKMHQEACAACLYRRDRKCNFTALMKDVLELLKEQEPVEAKIMGESKSHGAWWFACGACGHAIDPEDNFCRECGREIKWDD